jgi:polyisoprenyl-phosphate glycosyltransferase
MTSEADTAVASGARRPRPALLSVVTPAFNEADGLPQLIEELRAVLGPLGEDYEIVVVDDGSSDGTLDLLAELNLDDPRVRWVGLSRNFGHQAALLAGLEHARGDVVISMDADLQHPPALLPTMVDRWRDGSDVVYTVKRAGVGAFSPWRRLLMWGGYSVLRIVSGMKLQFGQSDFRLLDRVVVDALLAIPEREKFLRGLVDWIGFRQIGLEYDPQPRFTGEEKYTFRQLFRLVTTGVFAFSIVPLRLFTAGGFAIALLAFVYGVFAVIAGAYALVTGDIGVSPPGWASIAAAISFLGGLQLIGIGLLGEYLGRVYDQTKGRPTFVVRSASSAPQEKPTAAAEPPAARTPSLSPEDDG